MYVYYPTSAKTISEAPEGLYPRTHYPNCTCTSNAAINSIIIVVSLLQLQLHCTKPLTK